MSVIKSNKTKILFLIGAILIIVLSALITFNPFKVIPSWDEIFNFIGLSDISSKANGYSMSVHYLDVGKADAILIECDSKNILIDSGNVDPDNKVVEYLKKRHINNLDLVIATHPDKDHIGGMSNIIYEFEINHFMMPQIPEEVTPKSSVYEGMIYALNSNGIAVDNPVSGESFEIGGAQALIVAPVKMRDDTNNNSIVLKLTYGNDSFLFTGDAQADEEADILKSGYNIQSTVLKVGHHGSKTSTTESFLESVRPEYAVISVGEDDNNLPKKVILDRLSKNGVRFYRTDLNGTIVIATNGDGINIFTQK